MLDENLVIDAIVDLLESITIDDETVIKEVFNHIPSAYTKYPSAYVIPLSWEEDFIDLRDTGVTAVFRIGIVYTIDPDLQGAQIAVRDTAALVRTTLQQQENLTLDGTVDWSQPTSANYTFDTKEQRVTVCEIDLSVRKRYSRYQ